MKKIVLLFFAFAFSLTSIFAQDVTKFLGIPVDGFKSDMIQKLKAKGYKYDATLDCLTGEFNGRDVNIHVVTNNNKVYRIMVADANYISEGDIKIRFNHLCDQFDKNDRYVKSSLFDEYKLSDEEDISYEMSVNNKRYQASYYQIDPKQMPDSATIANNTINYLVEKYGSVEALANLSEDERTLALAGAIVNFMDMFSDKSVWFMINERYGKYNILMYYDNKKNEANGEDL